MKTYRRRGKATDEPHDVVLVSSHPVPNSAPPSENLTIHGDDGRNKGFADSNNESQIAETMVLHADNGGGDDDDDDYEAGNTPIHPRKNHINACRRSTRKRKSKNLVDSGQLQGPMDSSNSIAEEGITADNPSKNHNNARHRPTRARRGIKIIEASDSDVIKPHFPVRGQRQGQRVFNTSVTPDGLLNTSLFPRYMEHIWSRVSEEKKNLVAFMDCLWFRLYKDKKWKERVLEWIKTKNIFSKKYVIVPIVLWSHWNLLILCNFGESLQAKSRAPCMLLLDSLQLTNPKRLEPLIRKFVMDMYNKEERPETKALIRKIPLLIPSVPQQKDDKKCGYFVLYYIHLFIENAPENFSVNEGYPYFMKEDWFTLEEFNSFCRTLDSIRVDTSSSDDSVSGDTSSSDEDIVQVDN